MIMRSNHLTSGDVFDAVYRARKVHGADAYVDEARDFKPRREQHGVEFFAYSYSGVQASQHNYEQRAVSWSDYGYVIAYLFNKDPHAQIGHYKNAADFVEQIREHPRQGESTGFLDVLDNIEEYA